MTPLEWTYVGIVVCGFLFAIWVANKDWKSDLQKAQAKAKKAKESNDCGLAKEAKGDFDKVIGGMAAGVDRDAVQAEADLLQDWINGHCS